MNINRSSFHLIQNTTLQSAQKTPVGMLLAQAEEFKKEGDKQSLQLQNLSERVLFQRETQGLYQTITDTINLLSAQGVPFAEIRQRVSTAINLYRGQLNSSFNQFKEKEVRFNTASASFNPAQARAARAANSGNDFTPPQVTLSNRVKQRKSAVAQCLLTSMDPESITGAMPCVAKHAAGLSESEKKELDAAVPNLVAGKALTEMAAVPAVVSKVVDKVVTVAVKGYVLGAVIEGQEETDKALRLHAVLKGQPVAVPGKFNERVEEARKTLNGENLEFNKVVHELVPSPVKSAGKAAGRIIQQGIDYAAEVDKYTQERFCTLPGIVQNGIIGTVEMGTAAAAGYVIGPTIRGSMNLVRAAAQGSGQVYKTLNKTVAANYNRSVSIKAVEQTLAANQNRTLVTTAVEAVSAKSTLVKSLGRVQSAAIYTPVRRGPIIKFLADESGCGKLPVEREFFIKLFLELDYHIGKGGKGSHLKLVKPNSPMVTIPLDRELATGTAKNLMRIYEKAKSIQQSSAMPLEPVKPVKLIEGPSHNKPLSHRIDYSQDYLQGAAEYINPKEFNGVLSKDLFVVQYHSSNPLHQPRTHKWFMPICEGNKHCSITGIQDAMAKLSAYGEITEVTLARIPAGEPVRFFHGRAKLKADPLSDEIRPGGGVQYRFYDFDHKWIVATRKLPF